MSNNDTPQKSHIFNFRDHPILVFLGIVVAAFMAGINGWIYTMAEVDSRIEKYLESKHKDKTQEFVSEYLKNRNYPEKFPNLDHGELPVGSIIPSMLTEIQLQKEVIGEWILADGRTIPKTSRYAAISGKSNVPDLRGMFLRGLNAERSDGYQDPDGNARSAGDLQSDELKHHSHTYINAGVWGRSWKGEDGDPKTAYMAQGNTGEFGGKETRPKNIAVYFYIRIN